MVGALGFRALRGLRGVVGKKFFGDAGKATTGLLEAQTSPHWAKVWSKRFLWGSTFGGGGAIAMNSWIDNSWLRKEDWKKNGSFNWLLGSTILLAKCIEKETIIVNPLTKNGRPIISGMTTQDPLMGWKNVVGKWKSMIEQSLEGSEDIVQEWNGFGTSIWQYMTEWDHGDGLNSIVDMME